MLQADWFMLMGAGGVFALLGLGAIIWDKVEQKDYYDSLAARRDMREYLEHSPGRPELGALKIGGWIAIAIGLALIVMGSVFWIRG